jgi:thiamine biosynthesis lipoprotein ApbE
MSCPLERDKTIVHLPLANCALGGSSQIDQKHIIDPRTGRLTFARVAAWSHARDAATADGLSTAFMILSEQAIAELCLAHPGTGAAITFNEEGQQRPCKIETIGHWPEQTPQVWCQCEV